MSNTRLIKAIFAHSVSAGKIQTVADQRLIGKPPLIKRLLMLSSLLVPLFLLPGATAQSNTELRTLFFDPVYTDNTDEILLSSGGNTPAELLQSDDPSRTPVQVITDIQVYQDSINQLIEESGVFEPQLAQQYLSLGSLYEQSGDYDNAVASFETAMHIYRVNDGLYTLTQENAVRALISVNKLTRNYPEADQYHEYLYYLLKRNHEPGSDALVGASLEWADWNLEAFQRMAFNDEEGLSVSGDYRSVPAGMLRNGDLIAVDDPMRNQVRFIPRSAFMSPGSNMAADYYTPDQLMDPRLKNAEDLYDEILETGVHNRELILRKANVTLLFKAQLESIVNRTVISSSLASNQNNFARTVSSIRRGYSEIREALASLAENLLDESPVEAAQVYVDLGDWEFAFDHKSRGYESYNNARDILLEQGYSEEEITRFITPEPAILIPAFAPIKHTRAFLSIPPGQDIPYIGFLDVSFNQRPNGDLRNITIEQTSENTGQRIRSRLMDMLRDNRTRPLMIAGEAEEQRDINIRYYYSY